MLDLFYDYTSNVALYPTWQTYLREQQPATLVTWGANDRYFVADGARAYLTDVPNAELHLLDTGHFAPPTHAPRFRRPERQVPCQHAVQHTAAGLSVGL
jgi:pimeloyl-ACP methyl ester carboxylesterase